MVEAGERRHRQWCSTRQEKLHRIESTRCQTSALANCQLVDLHHRTVVDILHPASCCYSVATQIIPFSPTHLLGPHIGWRPKHDAADITVRVASIFQLPTSIVQLFRELAHPGCTARTSPLRISVLLFSKLNSNFCIILNIYCPDANMAERTMQIEKQWVQRKLAYRFW